MILEFELKEIELWIVYEQRSCVPLGDLIFSQNFSFPIGKVCSIGENFMGGFTDVRMQVQKSR